MSGGFVRSPVDQQAFEAFVERYSSRWLQAAGLPAWRVDEVVDTLELTAAVSWDPPDGTMILRLRSWYTGETSWLYDWDGTVTSALEWIDWQADDRGAWVVFEREEYGNRTPWDE